MPIGFAPSPSRRANVSLTIAARGDWTVSLLVEVAPGQHRNAQRLEILRTDRAEIRILPLRRIVAVNPHRVAPALAAERNDIRVGCRIHAGNGPYPVEQLPLERSAPLHRNLQARKVQPGDQHTLCLKPRIIRQQIPQALGEQQRAEQQHQRQRHL